MGTRYELYGTIARPLAAGEQVDPAAQRVQPVMVYVTSDEAEARKILGAGGFTREDGTYVAVSRMEVVDSFLEQPSAGLSTSQSAPSKDDSSYVEMEDGEARL